MADKKRVYSAILYLENLHPDWQDRVESVLQLPSAYAIHDHPADLRSEKKPHVHLIVQWFGPVTSKNALGTINDALSAPGCVCCSTVQSVNSVRHMYNYLIHASSDAVRKGKYLYPEEARVSCNGFRISDNSDDESEASLFYIEGLVLDGNFSSFSDLVSKIRELESLGEPCRVADIRRNAYYLNALLRDCARPFVGGK